MDTLEKRALDSFTYTLDLQRVGNLNNGDALSSVTSVTSEPAGLTFTNIVHDSAAKISFRAGGGSPGINYAITCLADTVDGDTVHEVVYLEVLQ